MCLSTCAQSLLRVGIILDISPSQATSACSISFSVSVFPSHGCLLTVFLSFSCSVAKTPELMNFKYAKVCVGTWLQRCQSMIIWPCNFGPVGGVVHCGTSAWWERVCKLSCWEAERREIDIPLLTSSKQVPPTNRSTTISHLQTGTKPVTHDC